ncbi:hypothetical protein AJ80_01522 [Polytolypa hystricis UAMH7299]|uniref:OPA3-like protein n=1 Tax=Polytolypa hystricis (strain UAMH7299) TaxID=1447883 RepID=A0A2B7Z0V3_POLH7|nr:hypothetical protein AJ80_01522 [Polytolypa hystricis UAMH7299]
MSITLKLSSLVIRTLSKPIANQIKAQAREHERFRRVCVSFAQGLHRWDMRLRLGLLQNNAAALERQAAREAARDAAEAAAKKKQQIPTVKTQAQMKADEEKAARLKEKAAEPQPKPRIRPLTEAKAIDSGATFISEAFLFIVAGSLIVFEAFRSRRKAANKREDIAERVTEMEESDKAARRGMLALEKEIIQLKAKLESTSPKNVKRILPQEVWDVDEEEVEEEPQG